MSKTDDKKTETKKTGSLNLNRFKYGTTFMTGGHLQSSHGHSHVHGSGCGCSGPATDEEEDLG